jgi:hypothetical protein
MISQRSCDITERLRSNERDYARLGHPLVAAAGYRGEILVPKFFEHGAVVDAKESVHKLSSATEGGPNNEAIVR